MQQEKKLLTHTKIGTFPDKRNDPNIIAIHRFQKGITLSDGKHGFVFLTLKEVKKNGMRVYTIELMLNEYPLQKQGS